MVLLEVHDLLSSPQNRICQLHLVPERKITSKLRFDEILENVTCALGSNDPISNKIRVAFNKSLIGIFDGFQLPIL